MKRTITVNQAKQIGKAIGLDFNKIDIDQFRSGIIVELEHGSHDPETNVTNDNLNQTGKIAWAHLKEMPDYYTRLDKMEHGSSNIKKLYLSNDKKISGVCGGIADYFEIDSSLTRLAWILVTILTGILPGIIGYIVAAIVIPNQIVKED